VLSGPLSATGQVNKIVTKFVIATLRASIFCAACLAAGTPGWAQTVQRVALVVGVSDYKNAPKLPNTGNDATEISRALGRLGFTVDLLNDPDRPTLENAIRRFGRRADGAEASVFFYAGHALEVNGQNLLVPAPADVQSERDLRYETVDLELVLESMSGRSKVALLFLDSCRDNPFSKKLTATRSAGFRGLGAVDAAAGTLIAFATAPGKTAEDGSGRHSPFTTALLKHIERPGVEVRQMLGNVRREVRESTANRQLPWENSALEGEFFFRPASLPVRPAPAPAPAATAAAVAPPVRTPDAARDALAVSLRAALPGATDQLIQNTARLYSQEGGHKAQAGSRQANGAWRLNGRESAQTAEVQTLEGCQIRYNDPCVLLAVNDTLSPAPEGDAWAGRSMSRVTYDGQYDPKQIPVIKEDVRARPDVQDYAKAPGPKAIAMHPHGRVFAATNAADQRAAESDALSRCNNDPDRRGRDGNCFLYAVRNRVVLPLRLSAPRAPAATIADALRLAAPARALTNYQDSVAGKAIAVDTESGEYYIWQRSNRLEIAEASALALCQIAAGRPCVLLATNDELKAADPFDSKPRDIEVLRYAGRFDRGKLPFVGTANQDTANRYEKAAGPKALALKVMPARLVDGGGATKAEAERNALKACNEIVGRKLPCVLYAVNDEVVIAQKRTAASN